jgi:hypothetical protein
MALRLRIAGHEWQEIAEMCGIKGDKGAAFNLVNNLTLARA